MHSSKFAMSFRLISFCLFAKYIAIQLYALLVPRLRLPISLLTLTRYAQRLEQRWSGDQK